MAWVLAMLKGPWVSLMCSLWEEDTPWVFRGAGGLEASAEPESRPVWDPFVRIDKCEYTGKVQKGDHGLMHCGQNASLLLEHLVM